MMTRVDTSVRSFSDRYAITEFRVLAGDYEEVQLSSHRANDIREWWFESDPEAGVPVVLKAEGRHLVPEENDDLDYHSIRIPRDMAEERGVAAFLVPDEQHTRTLMGFTGE